MSVVAGLLAVADLVERSPPCAPVREDYQATQEGPTAIGSRRALGVLGAWR